MTAVCCPCGNPDCSVPAVCEALAEFEASGGNLERARLLWCVYPGCRSFEIVDDLTHRLTYTTALCPDHGGAAS